jgi:CRP/FNR family transcriptional regulator, cyclic AMP receptor protein
MQVPSLAKTALWGIGCAWVLQKLSPTALSCASARRRCSPPFIPKFSDIFVEYLLARNIRYQEDLIDQLFNSSEKRLARILLIFAGFGKDGIRERTEIPKISQETLAEMVGTTRSRVSSFMNKFRKLGFIDYNGELEVHRSLLNVVLHE